MSDLEDVLKLNTSPEELARLDTGMQLYHAGNYGQAVDVLTKLLVSLPQCEQLGEAMAHRTLGLCYEELAETESDGMKKSALIAKGLRELNHALECMPKADLVSDGQKDLREIYEAFVEGYLNRHPELKSKNL